MKKSLCKHLLLLMVAVLSITSLTSCKDDDDSKSNESRLVGTWVTEVYESGDYYTFTLVLNKDGKGLYVIEDDFDSESTVIKWSVVGESILSIAFADEDYEDPISYSFSLSKDGKTLKWSNYTFKKK